jgi:hypothetical protein
MTQSEIELVNEKYYWVETKDYPGTYHIMPYIGGSINGFGFISDEYTLHLSDVTVIAEVEDYKPKEKLETCQWKRTDSEINLWEGSCGAAWNFEVDTPKDNEMEFCPFCGRHLEQIDTPIEDDEEL